MATKRKIAAPKKSVVKKVTKKSSAKKSVRSDSVKAKNILRDEIRGASFTKKNLIDDINNLLKYDKQVNTPFSAGKRMVQDGNFACYTSDMKNTLSKIYGKEKVKSWGAERVQETYKNLMAREIAEIHKTNRMTVGTAKKKSKK